MINPIDREDCPDWQEWKRLRNLYYGAPWPDSMIHLDAYCDAEKKIKKHITIGDYILIEKKEKKPKTEYRDDTLAYAMGIIVILLGVILYMLIRQ